MTHTSHANAEAARNEYPDLMPYDAGALHPAREFLRLLYLERKRFERSGRPLWLLLIDLSCISVETRSATARATNRVLLATTRVIDVKGWYDDGRTIGVIFTEYNSFDKREIERKITYGLTRELGPAPVANISLKFYAYPPEAEAGAGGSGSDTVLYPDVKRKYEGRRGHSLAKRAVDIAGSLVGFILFSPFFIILPVLIKLTSPGPVVFRQKRVGLYGKQFLFYKFRTMYVNNDERVHKEYVQKLIAGRAASGNGRPGRGDSEDRNKEAGKEAPVYKITNDRRVTPIGRILRKTSLDELPQFFNVLIGDMSLVGPRPPIAYEVENYESWHRCRVVEVKPGITGLWQVTGRSSTTFDEMVRLDIRYSREWSLWLDLKILAMTPWSVIKGKGAY